jgi:hypothetical protein
MAKGPKFCVKLTLQNCCSFFKETVQRDPKVAKKTSANPSAEDFVKNNINNYK